MSNIERQPTSVLELLMLGDEPLAELVEERRKDGTERFAFCRRLGHTLREARERRGLTVEEVAIDSGTSSRLLGVIEAGALDRNWISDQTIELVAETLGLDANALYEGVDAPSASSPKLPRVQWDALRKRYGEWLSGAFEVRSPLPLPARSRTPNAVPQRSFGRGLSVSPIAGRLDAVVLQVAADALGELADGPLLVVLQKEDGTILAQHVFDGIAGIQKVELATDARATTANDVVMILAKGSKQGSSSSASLFAQVSRERLDLKERHGPLDDTTPIDRYRRDDPFENHPLFRSEEQAQIEEAVLGEEPEIGWADESVAARDFDWGDDPPADDASAAGDRRDDESDPSA